MRYMRWSRDITILIGLLLLAIAGSYSAFKSPSPTSVDNIVIVSAKFKDDNIRTGEPLILETISIVNKLCQGKVYRKITNKTGEVVGSKIYLITTNNLGKHETSTQIELADDLLPGEYQYSSTVDSECGPTSFQVKGPILKFTISP